MMRSARLLQGDCREVLRSLPADSVHCVVTSPPYWGLRSYLDVDDPAKEHEIGLERTPEEWVGTMVDVFRGVHRALRPDGTAWVNLGDCFYGAKNFGNGEWSSTDGVFDRRRSRLGIVSGSKVRKHLVLKDKDLVGQPWRVALALQGCAVLPAQSLWEWAEVLREARTKGDWLAVEVVESKLRAAALVDALGLASSWYLRSDIVWAKPNPMPESVYDRPTRAHEYLFLLTKSARYFYDAEAVREPLTGPADDNTAEDHARAFSRRREAQPEPRQGALILGADAAPLQRAPRRVKTPDGWDTSSGNGGHGNFHREGRENGKTDYVPKKRNGNKERILARERGRPDETTHSGNGADRGVSFPWEDDGRGKNKRSVWTIPPSPYSEAHFATFPPALVEPCIKAGTSEHGCCPSCGAPWKREIETEYSESPRHGSGSIVGREGSPRRDVGRPRLERRSSTTGWAPSCHHPTPPPNAGSVHRAPCLTRSTAPEPPDSSRSGSRAATSASTSSASTSTMAHRRIADDAPLLNTVTIG